MKMHRFTTLAAALLLTLVVPRSGTAQESMATGGYVAGSQKVMSEIALPDGNVLRRVMFSVGVTADDPENPFHLGSQDCLGSYVFTAAGSLINGRGMCDFVSPDGDLWWLTIDIADDGTVYWSGDKGTGKLAGIEHSGTTVMQAEWADGKVVGRWEGTMTRK